MNVDKNRLKQSFQLPFVARLATNGNKNTVTSDFLIWVSQLIRAFSIAAYPV